MCKRLTQCHISFLPRVRPMLASPAAPIQFDHRLAAALARASAAIARLDQALSLHPLLPAFLHRTRLDAVRRQAAVDGRAIDPWHLAATIEGLRLRMEGALHTVDRGAVIDAAGYALSLHQWLCEPDFDQEGEVRRAMNMLDAQTAATPLLAAAAGVHAWIEDGGGRAPMRAALVRFWTDSRLLQAPVPLTGSAAFRAGQDWAPSAWIPAFLEAVAGEAQSWLDLLFDMERSWRTARAAAQGQKRTSRAPLAVDVMAATPLISATTLAGMLGMSIKNAVALLDRFRAEGIAVEVTHRSARRLFGLAGLAPLREAVAPRRRPEPGRGPGRPPHREIEAPEPPPEPTAPLLPMRLVERPPIDYAALEAAMAVAEDRVRRAPDPGRAPRRGSGQGRRGGPRPLMAGTQATGRPALERLYCHVPGDYAVIAALEGTWRRRWQLSRSATWTRMWFAACASARPSTGARPRPNTGTFCARR